MTRVLVVVGPTSVGKTKMGVELAKALNGEVISGDSMQIYKRMDIGTAKVTKEEMDAYLATCKDVALGSDAFFPFSDNIERAYRSGVKYIAEPGGSIRDDAVIECADKYGMAMAFTGMRLFHH